MDIGLRIKKFREQQKISQEELALKIFVSRQTISNWETNKSCPDIKSLMIERFKKNYDIQTCKEILAFIDGKQLTYDETQQEIGKRNYQKIIFAFLAGVTALAVCLTVIFICKYLSN